MAHAAPTTPVQTTAANVRAELARAGKSARTMARDLGWSGSRTSRRMSGEIPFDVAELAAIAQYLDISITVLLTESAA